MKRPCNLMVPMTLAAWLIVTPVSGQTWLSFRGNADQTGVAAATRPVDLGMLWTSEVDEPIESTAAVDETRLYFATLDGSFHALDWRTGKPVWSNTYETEIASSPTVIDSMVLFGDEDGRFRALHRDTGKEIWSFTTEGGRQSSASETMLV